MPAVLAVDTGPHNGFALWESDKRCAGHLPGGAGSAWTAGHVSAWEVLGLAGAGSCAAFICLAHAGQLVVSVESLHIGAESVKKSRAGLLEAIEIVGVLRYLASRHGCMFVQHTPGQAAAFGSRERLDATGLWVPGKDHARSACRHLLLTLSELGVQYVNSESDRSTV